MVFSDLAGVSPVILVSAIITLIITIHFLRSITRSSKPFSDIPLITLDGRETEPGHDWYARAKEVISKGLSTVPGVFQVWTGTEPLIVLPNRFAQELKSNEPKLSFVEAVTKDFPFYPGFETFKASNDGNGILAEFTRTKLTQSIGLLIDDLVEECDAATKSLFPDSKDWAVSILKDDCIKLVSRLSTRAFIGPDMSQNDTWLNLSKDCTIDSFIAAGKLRVLPELFRYIAVWFMPECAKIRRQLNEARALVDEEVRRREARTQKAIDAGETPRRNTDAMEWLGEMTDKKGRPLDQTLMQMGFTVAGLHTTNEAFCNAMIDCCRYPEVVPQLRAEIASVIREHGWSKSSLFQMKLLDSFLRESARCTPLELTSMNRITKQPIRLSDGTTLPAHARIALIGAYQDPSIYDEPEKFKADRFLQKRLKPGQENAYQHVTAASEHIYFGLGRHACPGRFFANIEMKIGLCFLLLRYDWELATDGQLVEVNGLRPLVRPDCKVKYRSRRSEIDLHLLKD